MLGERSERKISRALAERDRGVHSGALEHVVIRRWE
jgi:hypothetical protein